MDGLKGMKFSKNFTKYSSENSSAPSALPPPPSTPSGDDDSSSPPPLSSQQDEPEKSSKLKFPSALSSLDLDPLRVKDQMGRLGGKMKSSLNKISDKIPLPKKSGGAGNDIDDFEKVIQTIETDELRKKNEMNVNGALVGESLEQSKEQPLEQQEGQDSQRPKGVVAQISNVKGKLSQLGKAAKQRLSSIQSSPNGAEENDSAHSSGSKDSNNSLTATAKLSRTGPVLLHTTSTNSSEPGSASAHSPHIKPSTSLQDPNQSPSAVLVDELLELWTDVDKEKEESHDLSSPSKLSRRPSEYLEFENTSTSSPLPQAPVPPTSSTNNSNETTSHTPFLYPKVKKLSFLKSASPNSTPPLPVDSTELYPDESDPYYQPYGPHNRPPSLSGAKHWVEKKILQKRNVHHLPSDQQTTDFFLQTETVEDDNCV